MAALIPPLSYFEDEEEGAPVSLACLADERVLLRGFEVGSRDVEDFVGDLFGLVGDLDSFTGDDDGEYSSASSVLSSGWLLDDDFLLSL